MLKESTSSLPFTDEALAKEKYWKIKKKIPGL